MHRYTNFQTILQPADITVSGNRGNDPLRIDFPDSVVIPIRKVKISLFIEYHAVGAFQLRLGCGAAIPFVTLISGSRQRIYKTFGVEETQAVIYFIRKNDIALAVYPDSRWKLQSRPGPWASVAFLLSPMSL